MSTHTPNIPNGESAHPDEGLLLAYVEDRLSAQDDARIGALLAGNHDLRRQLDAMRLDRTSLVGLPELSAPVGLIGEVEVELEQTLERNMLLELERGGRSFDQGPPVSKVRPYRQSVVGKIFAEPATLRLALAASLLLVVGAGAWFGASALSRWTNQTTPGPFAIQDADTPDPSVAEPTRALAGAAPVAEAELAEAPPGAMADATSDALGADLPITLDRAVELLAEGRLAMRVLVAGDSRTRRAVERVGINGPDESRAWVIGGPVPGEIIAMVAPSASTPGRRTVATPEPIVVGENDGTQPIVRRPGPSMARAIGPVTVDAWNAEVDLDQRAIASLRAAFESAGASVTFQELSQPHGLLVLPDADSILWWSRPAATWQVREVVPVVIEAIR